MTAGTDPKSLTIFLTGATSGFGKAATRRFAVDGAKIIATGRRQDRLEQLASEFGGQIHPLVLDVRDKKAVDVAIDGLPAAFKDINLLVNNAGLALGMEPAQEVDPGDWEVMVDTNIKGVLHCTRKILPLMVAAGSGHVINISSVAGNYPYPGGNVYGASKAFVTQFSLNLRADLVKHNVRVTNIEPGLAETEFSLVRFKGDADKAAGPYQNLRPMTAEDIAEAIYWTATLPAHVNINRLEMMPTIQAFGPFAFHREG